MATVGWIGLGAMGAPMAACLARAGNRVTGYDLDPGRLARVAEAGVRPATSPAAAAAGAEVAAVMVATPAQVEAVLFGPDGVAEALRPGAVVMLMATVGPTPVASWNDRLAVLGLELVDAPVSGGVARAAAGDLLVMLSGRDSGLARARPLADTLAGATRVVGDRPGEGQKVKLVNQLLAGVHIAAAAEALAFAEALGLDTEFCWEVVRHGAAASFMLDNRGARMLAENFGDVQSALDIFVKDMGLVVDAARGSTFPAPLAAAAEQLYLSGRRAGFGTLDDSSLIEILRGRARPAEVADGPMAR